MKNSQHFKTHTSIEAFRLYSRMLISLPRTLRYIVSLCKFFTKLLLHAVHVPIRQINIRGHMITNIIA